jgi:hypothetical protein
MLLRKGAAGSELQVSLEGNGSWLVGELDGDVKPPGAVTRGVGAPAGVVVGEARRDVGGATDVEVWPRIGILENVDEPLLFRHARREQRLCRTLAFQNTQNERDGTSKIAVSAIRLQVEAARMA